MAVSYQVRSPRKVRRYRVPAKDRDFLVSNLALLLKSALPIEGALQSLHDTTRSRTMRKALRQIMADIDDGMPLWESISRSGTVNEQTLALIRLGEQTGNLVANLQIAALQEKRQRAFKAQLRTALMYPSFVIGLALIIGTGVAWFILPKLANTFDQLRLDVPLITRALINFGKFLKTDGFWAIPLAFVVIVALVYVLFFMKGTRRIGHALLFHAPGIGRLIREIEIARFGHLLGMLLNSGLGVTESWQLLGSATSSRYYRRLYQDCYDSFEEGFGFRTTFGRLEYASKLIPSPVQQMLIAGERSGSLSETLSDIGDIYDEKSSTTTKNLEVIIEPVLLLVVSGGVVLLAIAVILPIYGLMGKMQP